jgi:hypothetical protein
MGIAERRVEEDCRSGNFGELTMTPLRFIAQILFVIAIAAVAVVAQTGSDKQFVKEGLTFDYPAGWTLQDDSNKDGQNLTLARADLDISINVFVHRGRITPDKLPDAKKLIVDPYIDARMKQFIQSGATPKQTSDQTQIAGNAADGVVISASLGGEAGAAKIYWALVGNRVVLLTFFGPDKQLQQYSNVWDVVRNSIKIEDPKAAPKASPKP